MKTKSELNQALRDNFDNAQKNPKNHKKNLKQLLQLSTYTSFDKYFINYVDHIASAPNSTTSDRLLEYIGKFILSFYSSEDQTYFPSTVESIADFLEVGDAVTREYFTKIIAQLLQKSQKNSSSHKKLWNQLIYKMSARARDVSPKIRQIAVQSLSSFQNPNDEEDVILNLFIDILQHDTVAHVRREVLSCILITEETTPIILTRIYDNSSDVKKFAYKIISTKIDFFKLTEKQKTDLILNGLHEKNSIVKDSFGEMLENWLNICDSNPITLLSYLDLINNEKNMEILLQKIFLKSSSPIHFIGIEPSFFQPNCIDTSPEEEKHSQQNENLNLTEFNLKLSKPQSFFWRTFLQYLSINRKYDLIEEIISDTKSFCQILESNIEDEFILNQLLKSSKFIDLQEEIGRRDLNILLENMIKSDYVTENQRCLILQVLKKLEVNELDYTRTVVSIISDILDPLDNLSNNDSEDLSLSENENLKSNFNENSKSINGSESFNNNGTTSSNENLIWIKCLNLTKQVLIDSKKGMKDPSIPGLASSVIIPSIQSEDPTVRQKSIECLGLYCFTSKQQTINFMPLILQVIENDRDIVKETAITVLWDLISLYGLKQLNNVIQPKINLEQNLSQTSQPDSQLEMDLLEPLDQKQYTLLKTLKSYFKSNIKEYSKIREKCVQGFARSLLNDSFQNDKILMDLILLYFTEENNFINQCLNIFFESNETPNFSNIKTQNQNHLKSLENVFLPTLRSILNSNKSSNLSKVNFIDVGKFLIKIMGLKKKNNTNGINQKDPDCFSNFKNKDPEAFVNIFDKILTFIIKHSNSKNSNYNLSKNMISGLILILNDIEIEKKNQKGIKFILFHFEILLKITKENLILNSIKNLKLKIENFIDKESSEFKLDKNTKKFLNKKFEKILNKKIKLENDNDSKKEKEKKGEKNEKNTSKTNEKNNKNKKKDDTEFKKKKIKKSNSLTDFLAKQASFYSDLDDFELTTDSQESKKKKEKRKKIRDEKRKQKKKEIEENNLKKIGYPEPNKRVKYSNEEKNIEESEKRKTKPNLKKHVSFSSFENIDQFSTENIEFSPTKNNNKKEEKNEKQEIIFKMILNKDSFKNIDTESRKKKEIIFKKPIISKYTNLTLVLNLKKTKKTKKEISNVQKSIKEKNEIENFEKKKNISNSTLNEKQNLKKRKIDEITKEKDDTESENLKKKRISENGNENKKIDTESENLKKRKKPEQSIKKKQKSENKNKTKNEKIDTESETTKILEDNKLKPKKKKKKTNFSAVVVLTGFKDSDPVFSLDLKKSLSENLINLNVDIKSGENFDSTITHVIIPPGKRTMTSLAAICAQKWVLNTNWVTDSAHCGNLLPELNYGIKKERIFQGKKLFISQKLKTYNDFKLLGILGKAKILNDFKICDIIVFSDSEISKYSEKDSFFKNIVNNIGFYNLIQPL